MMAQYLLSQIIEINFHSVYYVMSEGKVLCQSQHVCVLASKTIYVSGITLRTSGENERQRQGQSKILSDMEQEPCPKAVAQAGGLISVSDIESRIPTLNGRSNY